jgi:SAM-dependent methyltransferase
MQDKSADSTSGDPIAAQFERWVYPQRIGDLATVPITSPMTSYPDLRTLYALFWPKGTAREDLDILVAGCGSLQAAAQAFAYPKARVVGIDVSKACLDHTETLKRNYNLTNLTLRQLRVEDAGQLGADFDFIICHGVLHHLADPAAGLRALGGLLRPEGVIDIMVNGKYGRAGVIMLQELFRVMGLEPDPAGVQAMRQVLASLPPAHPVQNYRRLAAHDLAHDEILVHTFLSRRDSPFSSSQCLELVAEAGLAFQGWKENALYHADTRVASGDRLWPLLSALKERQLWETVEILDASLAAHRFHACRTDRDPSTYRIQFEGDAFLDYIPISRVGQTVAANRLRRQPAFIARPPFPAMALDDKQFAVFQQIDSARSIRACLAGAGMPAEDQANVIWARHFFSSLWRSGYAMYRLA